MSKSYKIKIPESARAYSVVYESLRKFDGQTICDDGSFKIVDNFPSSWITEIKKKEEETISAFQSWESLSYEKYLRGSFIDGFNRGEKNGKLIESLKYKELVERLKFIELNSETDISRLRMAKEILFMIKK